MFTVNYFKGGRWMGYFCEESKGAAIATAQVWYSTGEYDAVNVESPGGKVLYVRKRTRGTIARV